MDDFNLLDRLLEGYAERFRVKVLPVALDITGIPVRACFLPRVEPIIVSETVQTIQSTHGAKVLRRTADPGISHLIVMAFRCVALHISAEEIIKGDIGYVFDCHIRAGLCLLRQP